MNNKTWGYKRKQRLNEVGWGLNGERGSGDIKGKMEIHLPCPISRALPLTLTPHPHSPLPPPQPPPLGSVGIAEGKCGKLQRAPELWGLLASPPKPFYKELLASGHFLFTLVTLPTKPHATTACKVSFSRKGRLCIKGAGGCTPAPRGHAQ